jgi:hypothetical protein
MRLREAVTAEGGSECRAELRRARLRVVIGERSGCVESFLGAVPEGTRFSVHPLSPHLRAG